MSKYAEGTTVTVARSREEIAACLDRYGADSVAIAHQPGRAVIAFLAHGRHIRLELDLPSTDREFAHNGRGATRTPQARANAMQAEVRRRWRALAMVVKAKLEVVESGISDFDSEWLAHIVLPDGTQMREHALPAIEQAYATGTVPSLLPGRAIEGGSR